VFHQDEQLEQISAAFCKCFNTRAQDPPGRAASALPRCWGTSLAFPARLSAGLFPAATCWRSCPGPCCRALFGSVLWRCTTPAITGHLPASASLVSLPRARKSYFWAFACPRSVKPASELL